MAHEAEVEDVAVEVEGQCFGAQKVVASSDVSRSARVQYISSLAQNELVDENPQLRWQVKEAMEGLKVVSDDHG